MGRLKREHLIEAAVWLTIVVVFYGYSFEFNREIEIYKFGATAWPRTVIFLLLLATFGNLYYQYKYGSASQTGGMIGAVGAEEEAKSNAGWPARIKLIAVLFTPFIFGLLLKPVGIYFAAPFFIALIIWLFGETRVKAILIVTAGIYVIFLGLFLVILNAPLPQGNMSPFYDYSAWILKLNTQLQGLW